MKWKAEDMSDQSGKIAVVTGSNTGTGYHIAHGLAAKGAHVILACRNLEKATIAKDRIIADLPDANVTVEHLDLADLQSVKSFSDRMHGAYQHLDLLVNNAGVMIPPKSTTKDGFELQFGTNHLGHFALTGRLLSLLEAAPKARILTMASIAHKSGKIDFDDLHSERKRYVRWASYSQSKLANLMFALELERRLKARNSSVSSLGCHPGWSSTDLQRHSLVVRFFDFFLGMNAKKGAAPCLYAATEDEALTYGYWGVTKRGEMHGWTGRAKITSRARNEQTAQKLWSVSCELTGVAFFEDKQMNG